MCPIGVSQLLCQIWQIHCSEFPMICDFRLAASNYVMLSNHLSAVFPIVVIYPPRVVACRITRPLFGNNWPRTGPALDSCTKLDRQGPQYLHMDAQHESWEAFLQYGMSLFLAAHNYPVFRRERFGARISHISPYIFPWGAVQSL